MPSSRHPARQPLHGLPAVWLPRLPPLASRARLSACAPAGRAGGAGAAVGRAAGGAEAGGGAAQGAGGGRGAGQAGGAAGAAGPDRERSAAPLLCLLLLPVGSQHAHGHARLLCCCEAPRWLLGAEAGIVACACPQASLETHKREMLGLTSGPAPQAWAPPAPAQAAPPAGAEPALRLSDASLVSAWQCCGVPGRAHAGGVLQPAPCMALLHSLECCSWPCCPHVLLHHTMPVPVASQALMRGFKKQLCLNAILDLGFSAQQAQVRGHSTAARLQFDRHVQLACWLHPGAAQGAQPAALSVASTGCCPRRLPPTPQRPTLSARPSCCWTARPCWARLPSTSAGGCPG